MPRALTIAALTVLCAACALAQVAEPIASGPPPVEELAAEAQRYYEQWRYDEVKALSLRMVTHHPDSAHSWRWRGTAYEGDEEWEQARKAYERALEIDPGLLGPRLRLASNQYLLPEDERKVVAADLVERCGDIIAEDPDNREAHLTCVWALDAMGDQAGALAEMQQFAEVYPDDPGVLRVLAMFTGAQPGGDHGAIPIYERALELDPDNIQTLHYAAWAYRAAEQHDRALEMLERMRRIDPALRRTYTSAGVMYAHVLNDLAKAIEQLDIAIALDPRAWGAWGLKVSAITAHGDPADAIAVVDEAVNAGVPVERLLLERGRAYVALSRYADAIEDYTRAIEAGPDATGRPAWVPVTWRAEAYLACEEYEKAWRDVHEARDLNAPESLCDRVADQLRKHMPEPEREGEE